MKEFQVAKKKKKTHFDTTFQNNRSEQHSGATRSENGFEPGRNVGGTSGIWGLCAAPRKNWGENQNRFIVC